MGSDRPSTLSDASSFPADRIARSAGVAGTATLASRVLGLGRETVLAALFGAGNDMDAFIVAFRIPNLLRDLFSEGVMSAAFVPTFTKHLTLKGKDDAWRLGNNVITTLILATGMVVTLGFIFARPLVTLYAGDYASVPGKLDLTISLTRLMLPFLMLVAVAAAVMGMLNSLRHYFLPALSPAAFNFASIVCAITLTPLMPAIGQPRIMSLAIAVLVGGVGQVVLQWPSLRREGFRYAPVLDLRDPGLRQVLLLMGPGTLGLAATQINLLVSTILAVGQGTGAVSWLQYAFRVIYLPVGLFGVSIATAVLPAVSRHTAIDDLRAVSRTVTRGMALMLIVNVPATVGLFLLARPIVQLLLERGHFLQSDTIATAAALQCYSIGLLGYSTTRIATPVFYALRRSRVPVVLSTLSVALNLTLSIILVRVMGFRGLAVATALSALVNGAMSIFMLRRQLGSIGGRHLLAVSVKILIASVIMAFAAVGTLQVLSSLMPGAGTVMQAARLLPAIGVGVVTLGVSATLLHIPEFAALIDNLRRRLAGRMSS